MNLDISRINVPRDVLANADGSLSSIDLDKIETIAFNLFEVIDYMKESIKDSDGEYHFCDLRHAITTLYNWSLDLVNKLRYRCNNDDIDRVVSLLGDIRTEIVKGCFFHNINNN